MSTRPATKEFLENPSRLLGGHECTDSVAVGERRSAPGGGDDYAIKRESHCWQRAPRQQSGQREHQVECQQSRQYGQRRTRTREVRSGNRELHSLRGFLQYDLRRVQVVARRNDRKKQYYHANKCQQRLPIRNPSKVTGHTAASQEAKKGQRSQRYPNQIKDQFHQS